MAISYAIRVASRFAFAVFALASLCATAYAQSEIKVLSSRPDSISGGDAVIQVRIPSSVPVLQVVVLRNGVDVTGAFVAKDLTTLEGLVGGLNVGANVILVKTQSGTILTKALARAASLRLTRSYSWTWRSRKAVSQPRKPSELKRRVT